MAERIGARQKAHMAITKIHPTKTLPIINPTEEEARKPLIEDRGVLGTDKYSRMVIIHQGFQDVALDNTARRRTKPIQLLAEK